VAVGNIVIVHYSSSPKPWQEARETGSLSPHADSNVLTEEGAENIAKAESKSKVLDKTGKKCYKKSFLFREKFEEEEKLKQKQRIIPQKKKPAPAHRSAFVIPKLFENSKKKKASMDFNKRYKVLRKKGVDAKTTTQKARTEF